MIWYSRQEAQSQMSPATWDLISHNGSLTEHLRQSTKNKIQHRLLSANWGKAYDNERQALHSDTTERCWVRNIEWRYESQLWIYARAIIPESTIQATGTTLTSLGVQSLGEVIFKDPSIKRSDISIAQLDKNSAYYPLIGSTKKNEITWIRSSILHFKNHPLLIIEIFLHDALTTT